METKESIPVGIQVTALWHNLQLNTPLYIVLLLCIYTLARAGGRSFLCTAITIIFVSFFSFWMTYISANATYGPATYGPATYRPSYNPCDTIITRCPIDTILCSANSKYLWDVLKAGGFVLLIKWILQLANSKAIIFWALLYPTVHNINYLYFKPLAHTEHHVDPHTNYGMDMWDLIFGTKHDWSSLEVHNHAAINCVFITAVIIWLWTKPSNQPIIAK